MNLSSKPSPCTLWLRIAQARRARASGAMRRLTRSGPRVTPPRAVVLFLRFVCNVSKDCLLRGPCHVCRFRVSSCIRFFLDVLASPGPGRIGFVFFLLCSCCSGTGSSARGAGTTAPFSESWQNTKSSSNNENKFMVVLFSTLLFHNVLQ